MAFKEMRSPRVFIPNKSYHDFRDAERFGLLVYLTQGEQNRFKINDLYRQIVPLMKGAEANDYLLISGPTTINLIAATILARRFGKINYLIYDAFQGRYVSRPILLDNVEEENVRPRTGTEPSRA